MTNKLKFLASMLTCILLSINYVWADYTITFKEYGASDGTAAKTEKADIIDSGGDYVSTISGATKVFQGKTGYGV